MHGRDVEMLKLILIWLYLCEELITLDQGSTIAGHPGDKTIYRGTHYFQNNCHFFFFHYIKKCVSVYMHKKVIVRGLQVTPQVLEFALCHSADTKDLKVGAYIFGKYVHACCGH